MVISMSGNPVILRTVSIKKQYAGRRILSSADIVVSAGKTIALVGAAGSGKSTFLNICAGLTKPDDGMVFYMGEKRLGQRYDQLAKIGVYLTPANGAGIPSRTLRQHFQDLENSFGVRDKNDVVDELCLGDVLEKPLQALSGGQRRLAEIALAAVRAPRLLLIDDPFRGLDPLVVERVGKVLRKLARHGCAILMAGQDPQNLMHVSDEVTWLIAGRIHMLGTPAQALDNERFRSEYLGGRI